MVLRGCALALPIAMAFAQPSSDASAPWAADLEQEMSVVMLQTSLAVERAAALVKGGAPEGNDEFFAANLEDGQPADLSAEGAEETLPDGNVFEVPAGVLEMPAKQPWHRPVSMLASAALRAGVLEQLKIRPFEQFNDTGGCGIAAGVHHERCICDEQEEQFCRLECLADHSCVGYVARVEACEYATTSRCPRTICRSSDVGNRGPIVSGPGGGAYFGCHVKRTWLHLPHWVEMTIDLGLPLLAVSLAFSCMWRRDFIIEHATIPSVVAKEPPGPPPKRGLATPVSGAAGLLGRAGQSRSSPKGP